MINASGDGKKKKEQTTGDINKAITELGSRSNRIKLTHLSGQNSVAPGLSEKLELHASGSVGSFFGAFNNGAVLILNGKSGDYTGDTMLSGGIIILGGTGEYTGNYLQGGIMVIKGDTGGYPGYHMHDGTILIDGNVKGDAAPEMIGGTLIITGNVTGELCPNGLDGTVYVAGSIGKMESRYINRNLTEKDMDFLRKYFSHYAIDASPSVFKKILITGKNGLKHGWYL